MSFLKEKLRLSADTFEMRFILLKRLKRKRSNEFLKEKLRVSADMFEKKYHEILLSTSNSHYHLKRTQEKKQ